MPFCPNCGKELDPGVAICPDCGPPQAIAPAAPVAIARNHGVAVLLCFSLGIFGAHRFYLGKIGTGILMLLTGGGLGVWCLVDFLFLVFGDVRDANRQPLHDKNPLLCKILFSIVCLITISIIYIAALAIFSPWTIDSESGSNWIVIYTG